MLEISNDMVLYSIPIAAGIAHIGSYAMTFAFAKRLVKEGERNYQLRQQKEIDRGGYSLELTDQGSL